MNDKPSLYLELTDGFKPTEYRVIGAADVVSTDVFSANQYAEDQYEFHFKYNVPTKKVRLSLLQLGDLANFLAIYNDLNPGWADKSTRFIKAKDIK